MSVEKRVCSKQDNKQRGYSRQAKECLSKLRSMKQKSQDLGGGKKEERVWAGLADRVNGSGVLWVLETPQVPL